MGTCDRGCDSILAKVLGFQYTSLSMPNLSERMQWVVKKVISQTDQVSAVLVEIV